MSCRPDCGAPKQAVATLSRKSNRTIDSDSDYRTYSDTSSEKLETNITVHTSTAHNDVDLSPLKTLMSTVLEKSENISNKLQQNKSHSHESKIGVNEQDGKSLTSTGSQKCGEMEQFKTLLLQAKERLTQSETAVELLQSQLLDEKFSGRGTMEVEIKQLQEEVRDLRGQLDEKTKECDNIHADRETVARQLGLVNCNHENMLEEILAEIQMLQRAAVNTTHPPTLSHAHINSSSPQNSGLTDPPSSQDGSTDGSHVEMFDQIPMSPDTTSDTGTQHQVAELTAQIHDLKTTLKATEETVHSQTHKMKHYRNILSDNGLLPPAARSRSHSVPSSMINCYRARISEVKSSQRRNSLDNPTSQQRRGSVSPTPLSRRQLTNYTFNESAEDTEKLFEENSKLKQQISGYRRVLRVFQGKKSMSATESVVSTESSSMSVESAHCYMECWLGMVDKFLSDLSQSADDHLHHSGITIDVNRLKHGLIEAKGAVQTLSESCGAAEKCNEGRFSPNEGRLSPDTSDSGCSDAFTSAQKTMKDCQLNTNEDLHSPGDKHRLRPISDTDQLLVQSDSAHQNGSLFNPTATTGSWLSECMNQGHSEAGSYTRHYYSTKTLQSAFREPVCSRCSRDMVQCSSGESRGEVCSPDTVHHCCQGDSTLLDHHCKDIDLTCCCQSQNETDSNKSRRCNTSNTSLKMLQNHSKNIETCATQLHHQMESLGKVIESYGEEIQTHFRPDVNSVLQEQLKELTDLRVVLEENINHHGVLENMIKHSTNSSEKTIQELTAKLAQTNKINQQQVVKESNMNMEKCRDNSCKTNADIELHQQRIASLEIELKAKKVLVDQLSTKCQQQEGVVEYYKKINKERTGNTARDEAKPSKDTVECLKAEVERSRDTIDEQSLHLCDKTREIDNLKCEMKKQNVILQEQDKLCRELSTKLEGLNAANEKVSIQLEFDQHRCDYYKQQNDKQAQLIQQLKDRVAKLKADLTLSVQMRNSLDKMMAQKKKDTYEATKLKDKYLYNLKVTYRELSKAKNDVRDEHRQYEEISSITRSLQTELKVRTQLMEKKSDMLTDDDKQTMITELLKELHQLRDQVTTILEQNKNMKAKLSQYYQHTKTKGQKQLGNIKSSVHEENVDKIQKLREEARRYNTRHGNNTSMSTYHDQGSTEDIRPSIAGLPVIRVTMVS